MVQRLDSDRRLNECHSSALDEPDIEIVRVSTIAVY